MTSTAYALPPGFVYLQNVDASILRDMRYAGKHNFIGRRIHGYEKPQCILTKEAALALSAVQKELQQSSLSLKVYDCYRPTDAVADFSAWTKLPNQQEMKTEFYPDTNKQDLFKRGYIAEQSGHSRGSTIDLTIVPIPNRPQPNYRPGQTLVSCKAPYLQRYRDNSIDMGTGYDCLDPSAEATTKDINLVAQQNRTLLREIMTKHGFTPYDTEWWHFTLKDEPHPKEYFNFPVL
jgi:zinc D-Ala-D-Ala dipeptidase